MSGRSVVITLGLGIGLGLVAAAARAAGPAASPSAQSFVTAICDGYKGKDARGVALDTGAQVRRYFAPELAALILEDREDAHGEVGTLDGDPFVDAQDWQIDRFTADAARRAGGEVVACDSAMALLDVMPSRA